jgi:hypothetical protein
MTPLDIAIGVLLVVSFGISFVLLAALTLLLEAVLFALGLGRRDWTAH